MAKETITARDMKQKKNVPMIDPVIHKMKNGAFMAKGKSEIGTGMCKILAKADAERLIANGSASKGF